MNYTNAEYYDMIMCVGACNGVLTEARRLYDERYVSGRPRSPRVLPSYTCFRGLVNRLHTTGSFQRRSSEGRPSTIDTELEDSILEYFEDDPTRSTRHAGLVLGLNHWKVWEALRSDGQHPYHYRKTQELSASDFRPRVIFAEWYCEQAALDQSFAQKILWTDEASFTRGGLFNSRNEHLWAHENPRVHRVSHYQHRWRINVWAGIMGDRLFGPVFIPSNLNSENYEVFLKEELEDMLEDLTVSEYRSMIFQHDGAPAHFARRCREYLDERFGSRWVGRGGPIAWPARSPDLTPLDFFLWGHLKSMVYATECDSENQMRQKIIAAFQTVTPLMLNRSTESVLRRMRLSIEKNGSHIEPYL